MAAEALKTAGGNTKSCSTVLAEVLGWIVAPVPFLLPWALLVQVFKRRFGQNLDFFKGADVLGFPGFGKRLAINAALWFSSYSTAWVAFSGVKNCRIGLKYVRDTPPARFVATEMLRSFGGLVVLSAYQGLYRARSQASRQLSTYQRLVALAAVGLWADFHFYATHRLLHVSRILYKHVHKVHHLSNNVNPWSGLSMHPIEHLVYFSALLPLLLVSHVPADLVQGLSKGLVAYPIPAHIGMWPFEKHHFQHHREFNYNYGSSTLFDTIFGTDYEGYIRRKLAGRGSARDEARADEAARQAALATGDKEF